MASQAISRARWSGEHRFYTGMMLAILVTVFVGFARSFFLRPLFPTWPSPPEKIFYVHGALFTAWIVLLVAQALAGRPLAARTCIAGSVSGAPCWPSSWWWSESSGR